MRPSRLMTTGLALAFCSAAGCALVYSYGDDYKDSISGATGGGGASSSVHAVTTSTSTSGSSATASTTTSSGTSSPDGGPCNTLSDCTNSTDECHSLDCVGHVCVLIPKAGACAGGAFCCDKVCCAQVCCGATCCAADETCSAGTCAKVTDAGAD